jgi:hypothetical protein
MFSVLVFLPETYPFERLLSPPRAPVKKPVLDPESIQVIHVHHYIQEVKPKVNKWEEIYHNLLKGF